MVASLKRRRRQVLGSCLHQRFTFKWRDCLSQTDYPFLIRSNFLARRNGPASMLAKIDLLALDCLRIAGEPLRHAALQLADSSNIAVMLGEDLRCPLAIFQALGAPQAPETSNATCARTLPLRTCC
jgi:hypothetical protein